MRDNLNSSISSFHDNADTGYDAGATAHVKVNTTYCLSYHLPLHRFLHFATIDVSRVMAIDKAKRMNMMEDTGLPVMPRLD
jgi:hypothetical protein